MAGFDLNAYRQQYGIQGHGADVNPGYSSAKQLSAPSPSGIGQFIGGVAHSLPGIASAAGKFVAQPLVDVGHLISGYSHDIGLSGQQHKLGSADAYITQRQHQLEGDLHSGKISRDQYKAGYKNLLKVSNKNIAAHQQFTKNTQQNYYGAGQAAKDTASTLGTVATVLAPELAAVKGAGLAAKAVRPLEGVVGAGKGLTAAKGAEGIIKAAPGKLVRNALVTQPTIQAPGNIVHDAQTGNIGGVALNAAALGAGGAAKVVERIAPSVKTAFAGRTGVLDEVFGAKNVKEHLGANPGALPALKQQEIFSLNQPAVKSGKISASDFLKQHYASIGVNPEKVGIAQASKDFQTYAKNAVKLDAKHPQLAVSADFRQALPKAIKAINKAGGASLPATERVAVVQKALDDAGIVNPTIKSQLSEAIINSSENVKAGDLKPIVQKLVVKSPGVKLDKGFIATLAPKEKAVLPSIKEATQAGGLTFGQKPAPVLGAIGKAVSKAGLSPAGVNRQAAAAVLKENFNRELNKTPVLSGRANDILNELQQQNGNIQLLGKHQIADALKRAGVDTTQWKTVQKALDNAHGQLPAELRGAAGKLTDKLISKVPGERQYLRVQQIGRFGRLNVFFQGKRLIKGEALAQAASGGHNPLARVPSDIKDYIKTGDFKSVLDDAVTDTVQSTPKVDVGIVDSALRQKAGLMTQQILSNHNLSLKDLEDNAKLKSEIDHGIQTIMGYPKGGFLDSNFAKAMNIAVFPFRFDAKIAQAGGKFLLKQDPLTRVALVGDIAKTHDYLNSPQGKQWRRDNKEVVALANYFTPVQTVGHFMDALGGKNVHIGDLGELGGMPLGFIGIMLKGQGISLGSLGSSPYVNPSTGQIQPGKIPKDEATRIKQGLADFISTTFSYPGATLGLESKSALIQNVPGLKTKSSDYTSTGAKAAVTTSSSAKAPAPLKITQQGKLLPKPTAAPIVAAPKKSKSTIPLDKFGLRKRHARPL